MAGDPLDLLGDGEPGPLYWIHGKERFLVDRTVTRLKDRVLDPRTRDFNYDLFYAKEAGPQKIVASARTLPMMAKRRLVIVRDADALDAKALDQMSAYVAAPAPETCLVFVADKADSKLKFMKAFAKHGVLVKCEPLMERQLPAFIRDEAKARKVKFEPGAAEMLADEVGADLGQLVDAVERLELYVAGQAPGESGAVTNRIIRPGDVEAVVATTRQRSVFELVDALGEGNAPRALGALGSLFAAREPGLRILAMIVRSVRQLLVVRELLDRRASRSDIAQAIGLPPFLVEKLETQARRHAEGGASLRAMHELVYRADRTLKSSKLDDERVMELLVLAMSRLGGAPAQRARR